MPSSYHSSTTDLLKKVRKIEIRTKALSHQIFAGEYHSAFKGRGMAFSEVREYQWGDDVRSMDWNVTARLPTPYIKVFEEERELIDDAYDEDDDLMIVGNATDEEFDD